MLEDLKELKIVRVGHNMDINSLKLIGNSILQTLCGVITKYSVVHFDSPFFEKIEAQLLTQILDKEIGGHILGITDADLFDPNESNNPLFGGKDDSRNVAVVSTKRLPAEDYNLLISRTLKVGLHELGHNFGLQHHYSYQIAKDGSYCPMTKGKYNQFGEWAYIQTVIDLRGLLFCDKCNEFLNIYRSR